MSYIERTARKLMPILNEIKKRMVPEKNLKDKPSKASKVDTLDSINEDVISDGAAEEEGGKAKKN
jgi:hypothetical protein